MVLLRLVTLRTGSRSVFVAGVIPSFSINPIRDDRHCDAIQRRFRVTYAKDFLTNGEGLFASVDDQGSRFHRKCPMILSRGSLSLIVSNEIIISGVHGHISRFSSLFYMMVA